VIPLITRKQAEVSYFIFDPMKGIWIVAAALIHLWNTVHLECVRRCLYFYFILFICAAATV